MNFLEAIFRRLQEPARSAAPILQEVRDDRVDGVTAQEFLSLVRAARHYLLSSGLRKGDRCALLAPNSIRWAALDLALMAEGLVVVPLYSRQAPKELAGMIADSGASMILCSDETLAAGLRATGAPLPAIQFFDEVFREDPSATDPGSAPGKRVDGDPVTIIYTSGTSGEPKGVLLNTGNLNHIITCTSGRLDRLMAGYEGAERIFHYLPLCFAASWLLLLSALSRNSVVTFSTDLNNLAAEIRAARPQYFLNVPAVLERVRAGVEKQIAGRGGLAQLVFTRAKASRAGLWLWLAHKLVFPKIRAHISPELKALICGSAPLTLETHLWFHRIGIPVLQGYGLTETTGICTLDVPGQVKPGCVGPAVPGIEMKTGENDEILVRGPNVFPGYWQREEQTSAVLKDGWFHTGDQGEVDAQGYWKIVGRVKNLIVLNSGHKVPPEPMEDALRLAIPGAQQVVIVGNQRSFLVALVTGADVARDAVHAALDAYNARLPHYQRVHQFHIEPQPLTIESGLLTANGKLRRDAIAAHFAPQIDALYKAARV